MLAEDKHFSIDESDLVQVAIWTLNIFAALSLDAAAIIQIGHSSKELSLNRAT
jgi:hypothetical protein